MLPDINALLASAVFALFLFFVFGALAFVGYGGMLAARLSLIAAWFVGVLGACGSMNNAPTKHLYVMVGIVGIPLAVGLLIVERGLTRYAAKKAALQLTRSVVRVLYSDTQTIEISNVPGHRNETLKLDTVATMTQFWEWDRNQVGMLLVETPPSTIEKPVAGEGYYADEDGNTVTFNPDNVPGIRIKQATVGMSGTKYLFNQFKSHTQTIQIGDRRFKVMLQSIRDKSSKRKKLIAYTFGILEE